MLLCPGVVWEGLLEEVGCELHFEGQPSGGAELSLPVEEGYERESEGWLWRLGSDGLGQISS